MKLRNHDPLMPLAPAATPVVGAACHASASFAQDFPSRPIRFVVPFAPGGGMATRGVETASGTPQEYGAHLKAELAKYAGIKVD